MRKRIPLFSAGEEGTVFDSDLNHNFLLVKIFHRNYYLNGNSLVRTLRIAIEQERGTP